MKAPKHLLNTAEGTPCRNGVETYHVKMLKGLISHSHLVFKHKLFFFKIQDFASQKNSLFYLQVLLSNYVSQFDESPSKYYGKTCQI